MQSITIGATVSKFKGDMPIEEFLKKLDEMGVRYHKKKEFDNKYNHSPYYEIYLENGISKEQMIEMVNQSEYVVRLA